MRTTAQNVKDGALAILACMLVVALGCAGTPNEGDRCNPDLSHDECASGLTCVQPANCAENYCCKTDGKGDITSTVAACQPGCDPCALAASLVNPPPECLPGYDGSVDAGGGGG